MKKIFTLALLIIILPLCFFAGRPEIEPHPGYWSLRVPRGWPQPRDIFKKNKLTESSWLLGKKIFYDPVMSIDGSVSCASCHQPFAAFATYDHDLSHGVNNSLTTRNAPGLFNLAWAREFHWDGSINHLEVQPLAPLTAANEMGETLPNILQKLQADSSYRSMFFRAFKDTTITVQRMLKALSQFTGTLVSDNSKYDKVKRGEARFEGYEARGYALFQAKCASCHKEPLFTDFSYRNNGLTLNRLSDAGRYRVTADGKDSLKFKVPSLRNVQLTFPYMHDGRLYSLYDVVDHYRKRIDTSQSTLDPLLKKRMYMTDRERNELVYFLYTLTDSSFIRNKTIGMPGLVPQKDLH